MKKALLGLFLISLLFVSCGPALTADGQFGEQEYIGKFRDITIYRVGIPSGTSLFLGIRENGDLASVQYNTGGKTPQAIPVIIIDGKTVTKEEALKILGEK